MQTKHLNNTGFTLIEALIAILVLSIGILALGSMQVASTRGNSTANKVSRASTSGGSSYEWLTNLSYDNPALDPAGNPHTQAEIAGLMLPSGVTAVTWNVTEWNNTDTLDNDGDGSTDEADELYIKSIALNVSYTNRTARTLSITFLKSEMF
jgi:prepilin-type N-terminal cleavage/methylation domain-containing protein